MLVALFLAVAAARPQDAEPIKIIKQSQEHDTESGKYSFRLAWEIITSFLCFSVCLRETLPMKFYLSWINFWYNCSYESENGIKVEESGEQKVIGDEAGTVSKGSFSYPDEGVTITVNWVADENGFQAKGDHLPTPPPTPDHVVKLLADLRAAGLL